MAGLLYFAVTAIVATTSHPWVESIGLAYLVFALFPWMAASVRRLHDTGSTGWWTVGYLIPLVNLAVAGMWCMEGQPHENRYGPDPMGRIRNPEFARES